MTQAENQNTEENTTDAQNQNSQEAATKLEKIQLDIGKVIGNFLHRVFDIEDCVRLYIPVATKNHKKDMERIRKGLNKGINDLDKKMPEKEKKPQLRATVKSMNELMRDFDRSNNSFHSETLKKSLFINLFAVFDKYVGELITVLYQKNPVLYKNLNEKSFPSEALQYESMEDLRQAMLDLEIEDLKRKSYVEQFKSMESRFLIETLTKFEEWSGFIEMAQRRNLFTHCDGVVNKQYVNVGSKIGYEKKEIGEKLEINEEYLFHACKIVAHVAVMLGHTLWRKVLPDDIENADEHLNHHIIFYYLHMEYWEHAILASEFALGLPKVSSDQINRIFLINYTIALNAMGKDEETKAVLNKKDWSAVSDDFKLAHAVATRDYQKSKEIMKKIGNTRKIKHEMTYHDWPLYRDFRNTDEFLSGYEDVYGYNYVHKLSEIAETKKDEVNKAESSESGE